MKMLLRHTSNPGGDIYCFEFEPERPLDYIAGQFAEFTIDHPQPDNKGVRRWFTLSSSPTEPLVAITVRCTSQRPSSFKRALRGLKLGDTVSVSDAMGDFVLPLDNSIPLTWIAGGIGITPFRSLAKWLSDSNEQRDIRLVHSINRLEDAIYGPTFAAAKIAEREIIDTTQQQHLDIQATLAQIPNAKSRLTYISGPEMMVENARRDLMQAGFYHNSIVVDQFLGYK